MTAPSIKEALKPCPFCGGKPELLNGGPGNWFVRCTDCKCTTNDVQRDRAVELWNTRATLQPSGERREAIAQELRSFHRNSCYPEAMDVEVSASVDRIILASGLVQDEAGIRADEREKELYYLRSILRQLREYNEFVASCEVLAPSIGDEVLADNIDWLDCHIDALAPPAPPIRSARNGGETQ